MPATGFITRSAAALLLACLLAGLLFSTTARAGECGRLCDGAFWQTATPQQVEAEIKAGANLEARDSLGFTPLHYAAATGATAEIVNALLKAGANPVAEASGLSVKQAARLNYRLAGTKIYDWLMQLPD